MRRRTFLTLAGCAAASVLLTGAPAHATTTERIRLYPPSGPLAAGRAEHLLVDPTRPDPWVPGRPRRLMTTVWFPVRSTAGPAAPFVGRRLAEHLDTTVAPGLGLRPGQVDWSGIDTHAVVAELGRSGDGRAVVLYSPGVSDSRVQGSGLAADLASHGYVVVTIDHTYETAVEFPDGLVTPRIPFDGPDQVGLLETIARVRTDDARSVLDRLDELVGRGHGPVAVAGHSGGGDAAVQALSEDRRLAAAVDLDGFLAYDSQGEHPMPAAVRGVDRPVLLMGSRSAVDRLPAPGEQPRWVLRSHRQNPAWRALWTASGGARYDVGVPAGRHHVFTDLVPILTQAVPLGVPSAVVEKRIGTPPDPRRAATAIRDCVRWFLDRHVRELGDPMPRYPDLVPVG